MALEFNCTVFDTIPRDPAIWAWSLPGGVGFYFSERDGPFDVDTSQCHQIYN